MKRKWILIIAAIMLLVLVTGFFIIYPKMKTDMEAKQKFKEIMGFDLPDNTKVNRYHYNSQNGFCAIDLVFDANEYDNVFQTFQRKLVDVYHPLIFQKETIYEVDAPYVYGFDDYPVLCRFPQDLNWVQEEPMEFIVGYDMFATGKNGAMTGFIDWLFVRDSQGNYHVMIQNG
ncbi:MAG: hypothetical protein IKP38_02440 [Clostridia bacterium]|nr:hypothetical protein [Clostridia bacterium]